MALRISLNSHVFRVYASDPVHNTPWQAKLACAEVAIKEGVIAFIQYGNGQTEPTKTVDNGVEDLDMRIDTPPPPTTGITLQDFFDALPQPFPEDISEKGPSNAPTWLNLILQSARGGRLVSHFIPFIDNVRHLHGNILRIERPEETRTYMVEAQFQKRHDAKCAVCLLAMSQGVGAYIRGLKEEAENKIPAARRKLTEKVLQVLAAECGKIRPGNRLVFDFSSERDAFGCTLRVDTSADESQPKIKEYAVNTEYRCKADAKAAVAFLAAEQGLVDILRFKDAAPPPDYVPFWEAQVNGNGDTYIPKRKGPDRDVDAEGRDRKKRKKGNSNGSEQGDASGSTPTVPKLKPPGDHLPPKPTDETLASSGYQPNARWKKPHANVSRGLGPTNAYVPPLRSMGQDRSGNRSGGRPPHPQGYHSAGPPSAPAYDSRTHTHPYDDRMGYRAGLAYPSALTYSPPDAYQNGYSAYPPAPVQGHHYQNPGYHPSPPVAPPPQPPHHPHHYSGYYGPPTPPHPSYGHYPYPLQYPPSYPHAPYSANYTPPVTYTSPPPPPSSIPLPCPPVSPPDQYSSRYNSRSQYPSHSPRSPPPLPSPMRSPLRHSHHASEYHHSHEANRQVDGNNRRRHSTVVEPRSRQNGFPPWETELQSNYYHKREPAPDDTRWQTNDQNPSPSQHSRHHTTATEPRTIKTERDTPSIPNHVSRRDVTTSKSNLDLLYEFCERNKIPRPTFYHEDVQGSDGSKKYAVWAEKDAHRLEIQNHFSSIEEGYEKLSKRVLQWERSRLEGK